MIIAARSTSFHEHVSLSLVGRVAGYLLLTGALLYVVSWIIQFAILGTLTLALGLVCLAFTLWARRLGAVVDRVLVTVSAIGSLTWNTETTSAFLLVGVGAIWAILAFRLLRYESLGQRGSCPSVTDRRGRPRRRDDPSRSDGRRSSRRRAWPARRASTGRPSRIRYRRRRLISAARSPCRSMHASATMATSLGRPARPSSWPVDCRTTGVRGCLSGRGVVVVRRHPQRDKGAPRADGAVQRRHRWRRFGGPE